MTETFPSVNAATPGDECSVKEDSGAPQSWRPKFKPRSKPCSNVAAVCPLLRATEMEWNCPPSPVQASSLPNPDRGYTLSGTNAENTSPARARLTAESRQRIEWSPPQIYTTRVCPFSFDARDAFRRSVRERRLEELREIEENQQQLCSRFKANPVRRYKPLVLTKSTRPLTVPQLPFTDHDS